MSKKKNDNFMDMLSNFFPDKMTSGQVIRSKRLAFGITLEEVAFATGISQSNLSNIENDKKSVGLVQATKIGLAIGLHPMTILFPNGIENDERFEVAAKKGADLLKKKMPLDDIAS